MVEDPKPPAYEPVALNGEDADGTNPSVEAGGSAQPQLVTSSRRSINRVLYSVAGWRASFRGIVCAFFMNVATGIVAGIFSAVPFVPSFVGTLLATMALIQLHTTWVHIVIAAPNPLPWYKRLPPFKRTFDATCIPVFVYWAATTLAGWVPWLLASAMNLPLWDPKAPNEIPAYDSSMAWKTTVISIVSFLFAFLVVLPAYVVLVRVQASLLPEGEDPIIPFDRSFDGTVEPSIVSGRGYVTWRDALRTFPRASWIRLYKLVFKAFLVGLAVWITFAAVLVPQIIFTGHKVEHVN